MTTAWCWMWSSCWTCAYSRQSHSGSLVVILEDSEVGSTSSGSGVVHVCVSKYYLPAAHTLGVFLSSAPHNIPPHLCPVLDAHVPAPDAHRTVLYRVCVCTLSPGPRWGCRPPPPTPTGWSTVRETGCLDSQRMCWGMWWSCRWVGVWRVGCGDRRNNTRDAVLLCNTQRGHKAANMDSSQLGQAVFGWSFRQLMPDKLLLLSHAPLLCAAL